MIEFRFILFRLWR